MMRFSHEGEVAANNLGSPHILEQQLAITNLAPLVCPLGQKFGILDIKDCFKLTAEKLFGHWLKAPAKFVKLKPETRPHRQPRRRATRANSASQEPYIAALSAYFRAH
jgi:hypothetical protein